MNGEWVLHRAGLAAAVVAMLGVSVACASGDADLGSADGPTGSSEAIDAGGTGEPAVTERSPGTPSGSLRFEDAQLQDENGRRVVLRGATLYAFPFYLSDGWVDWAVMVESRRITEQIEPILDRVAEAGMNTVRIPLGTDAWREYVYSLSSGEWLDRLERIVDEAAERDIVVVVTWWDALEWGSSWPGRHEESFDFMRAVHERVGDRANLVIEPMNEPRDLGWEEWQAATGSTIRFWREELGYEGALLIDTIDWSWSFDPAQADRILALDAELLGEPNLAFAIHRYANDHDCFCGEEAEEWERLVGRHVGTYPIVVTEVGNSNEGRAPARDWVEQFVEHLVGEQIPAGLDGVLAFTWRWQDANSMTEWDGVTFTAYGSQIVDALDPDRDDRNQQAGD